MMGINDLNILRHHRIDYAGKIDRDGSKRPAVSVGLTRFVISVVAVVIVLWGAAGV